MNCNDKIRHTCPPNSPYASCIRSEVEIPEFSTITSQCRSVDEVLGDVYTLIGNIKEEINLSSIASDCETLPTTKTVVTLIEYLINSVCTQKTQIDALIDQNDEQAELIENLRLRICP